MQFVLHISASESGQYSTFAQKMMSKMGYKSGAGLGKKGQGIVEPVGISKQKGRRGLGLILEGLEEETVNWDSSREHVVVVEEVDWMPKCSEACPSIKGLKMIN
jgi:cap1 methyltransferase